MKKLTGIALLALAFAFPAFANAEMIRLRIEAPDKTLFDSDLVISPCQATTTAATSTSGFCAVEQSGLGASWTWFDFGPMLATLGGYTGDWTNYWSWFSNLELGQTGLDTHALADGERLLLTYGANPLKLSLATTTIEAGATTTISVSGFGYDAAWNPVWTPVDGATLDIASTTADLASSTLDFSTTTVGTFAFRATKAGYAPSEYAFVTVIAASSTSTSTATTTNPNPNPNPSGGGGAPTTSSFGIPSAVSFLISKQHDDGSWGAGLYTDWAAIALSNQSGAARDKLRQYLLESADSSDIVTESERHAMALMANGINPYTGTSVNYIKKIADSFDGTQIGDASLLNDDIFALFPLLKAGYSTSDDIVKKTVAFIVSHQDASGSWGSIDLTAAGIQALSQAQSLPDVTASIQKAKDYLKSVQTSGGFGTSYATSWSLQAIAALGESQSAWSQNNMTPLAYLAAFQQADGGVEPADAGTDNRVWATAYAIPAAQGKTWYSLLSSFSKPPGYVETPAASRSSSPSPSPSPTATTSPLVATTTQPIATSSPTAAPVKAKTLVRATPPPVTSTAPAAAKATGSTTSATSSPATSPAQGRLAAAATSAPASNDRTLVYVLGGIGVMIIGYVAYRFRHA